MADFNDDDDDVVITSVKEGDFTISKVISSDGVITFNVSYTCIESL
jgi:hypothetical protein